MRRKYWQLPPLDAAEVRARKLAARRRYDQKKREDPEYRAADAARRKQWMAKLKRPRKLKKTTERQRMQMRHLRYEMGESCAEISRVLGVGYSTVLDVLSGRTARREAARKKPVDNALTTE